MSYRDPAGADFLELAREPTAGSFRRDTIPWLLGLFCLLLIVIPANIKMSVVYASLGTPARLLCAFFVFVVVIGFFASKQLGLGRKEVSVNPGVIIILSSLSLMLMVWGEGLYLRGSQTQMLNKYNAISGIIMGSALGIYAIIRIDTRRRRSIVLGTLLAAVTYSAIVGILQHKAHMNIAEFLKPPGYEAVRGFAGGEDAPIVRQGAIRAYGTLVHPLPYGAVSAAMVPLGLYFARYSSGYFRRGLAALATLALVAAIPTSIARSSIIALGVALLVYLSGSPLRRLANILFIFTLAYSILIITQPETFNALLNTIVNSADDPSVLVRVLQVDTMVAVFRDHPLMGVGLGGVTREEYGPIDNYWAVLIAEGGIIGTVAFVGLAVGGLAGIVAAVRRTTTKQDRDQVFAVGAVFVALLATSPTFSSLHYDSIFFIFFLLFGILWSGCSYPLVVPGRAQAPGGLTSRLIPEWRHGILSR